MENQDILFDCRNLADEILEIIKTLEPFAFPNTGVFIFEEYEQFLAGKKVVDLRDAQRMLANKLHGLKGLSGFIIPAAKQVCHSVEDLVKPLVSHEILLDDAVFGIIKSGVYKIQDLLDRYEAGNSDLKAGDWEEKIKAAFDSAIAFVDEHADRIKQFVASRSVDDGEIRHRKMETLSVTRDGYEGLLGHVSSLYNLIAASGVPDYLVERAGKLLNAYLDAHQHIKKTDMDLSRYERLVPSLAERYGIKARFAFEDSGVLADQEFWGALHEIFNHVLKNAVIHGLETPLERIKANKDPEGRLTVRIAEDTLNIFVDILDDGRGIDVQKLANKARDAGLIDDAKLAGMSRTELLNLVFLQGLSTKEQLDDNAGRGVGLNAVLEAVHRFAGECVVDSEKSQGTSWMMRFPKRNVSLPCFVVTLGNYPLVVPENYVQAFHAYAPERATTIGQQPSFRPPAGPILPMLRTGRLFGEGLAVDQEQPQHVMVVSDKGRTAGLVINDVLDNTVLFISPLSGPVSDSKVFVGATLYRDRPALILDVERIMNTLGDALPIAS